MGEACPYLNKCPVPSIRAALAVTGLAVDVHQGLCYSERHNLCTVPWYSIHEPAIQARRDLEWKETEASIEASLASIEQNGREIERIQSELMFRD